MNELIEVKKILKDVRIYSKNFKKQLPSEYNTIKRRYLFNSCFRCSEQAYSRFENGKLLNDAMKMEMDFLFPRCASIENINLFVEADNL